MVGTTRGSSYHTVLDFSFKKRQLLYIIFECVYQPEGQVERDVHCPQCSCNGIEQTHLLSVELPALTGHTVHPHQTVASIQQPGSAASTQNIEHKFNFVLFPI